MSFRNRIAGQTAREFAGVLLVVSLALGAAAGMATESDAELERCRYLHDRIERYTALRRGGGNGAQMERWRKAREKYSREYREKRCHRFGSRLTIRP